MLYEQYYRKTLKRAAVLATIKRFRVLIICVILGILALVAAYMGVFGIIYSSSECSPEIVYGEELDYKAKALFTQVSYEYTVAGEEEWTSDYPELIGDYEVRSVSRTIFGDVKYGDVYAFTILAKEIEVTCASTAVYGENPSVTADTADGDTLECASFTFGDKTSASTTVKADKSSIKIYNSSGTDVTSNYVINTVQSDISITQRTIEITMEDAEKTYDGTALTSLSYNITGGSLAYEDDITISGGGAITGAGETENSADIAIYTESGEDVSACYNINVVAGKLTVSRRAISLTTANGEWTYDGTAYYNDEYSFLREDADAGPVSGQTINVASYTAVTDAGEYRNELEFTISDAEGNDVTSNYDIAVQYGMLTVNKRAVTVTTEDARQVYNGTVLYNAAYNLTTGALADGQEAVINSCASITDAGSCENIIDLSIYSGQSDVTANYDISYNYGTLEVTVRQVTLVTADADWIYDGTEHSCTDYTVTSELDLAEGQLLQVATSSSIVNVSTAQNIFSSYYVSDADGADVTLNYQISFGGYGTLEIRYRAITFITESYVNEYDGTEQYCKVFDVSTEEGYGLADGQTAFVQGYATIINVGSTSNSLIINIFSNEDNVTENYEITYKEGMLTILPRDILVTAGSGEKYYDGTALTCDAYTYDGLADGHTLTASTQGSQTDAETGVNKIVSGSVYIADGNGDNVTENYSITCADGALTVHKRPVTIKTLNLDHVYDGYTYEYAYFTVYSYSQSGSSVGESNYGLISGHTAAVSGSAPSITDAGSCSNIFKVAITGAVDVTSNYDITYIYGTITISKRDVTVVTGSAECVYDGEEHSCTTFEVADVGTYDFVDGQKYTPTSFTVVMTAGNYSNKFYSYVITDASGSTLSADGNELADNYNISYVCGDLIITKRNVTIVTPTDSWVYDGTAHSSTKKWEYYEDTQYELVYGHELSYITCTYITDADTIDNEVTYNVYVSGSDTKVTDNYNIEIKYGTLTVTPLGIEVTTGSTSKVYDGTALTYEYITADDNLLSGHTVSAQFSGTQTEPGIGYNTIVTGSVKVYDADGEDISQNYTVTKYNYGTLTVYASRLIITAGSTSKVYDGTELTYNVYTYEGILEGQGHKVTATVEGSITTAGSTENVITSYTVTDANGNSLPEYYYTVKIVDGLLTVTQRSITINTGSGVWPYDGEKHGTDEFTVSAATSAYDGLVQGQSVQAKTYYVTNAGTYKNMLSMSVYDAEGNNVTGSYSFTFNYGTLTINKCAITITTNSHSWLYEGLSHSDSGYVVTEGALVDGHIIDVSSYTRIINVGTAENVLVIGIADEDGTNLNGNYEVTFVYGTLEVFNPLELAAGESYVYKSGIYGYYTFTLESGSVTLIVNAGDAEYALSAAGGTQEIELEKGDTVTITALSDSEVSLKYSEESSRQDEDGEEQEEPVIMTVTSDTTGSVYLKYMSYGDYDGQTWYNAAEYGDYIQIDGTYYSLSYLMSLALEDAGISASQVTVELSTGYTGYYSLPYYYATGNGNVQTSDVYVTGAESTYTAEYYYYSYLANITDGLSLPSEYSSVEEAYSDYVRGAYLSVPESTRAYLETVIKENGFDEITDQSELIAAVVNYVRNAATYNLDYDTALDSEDDVAVAFLSSYKEGVCRHYAGAATLLFRVLNIPARYTEGFYTQTYAGIAMEITVGHAWTEVYIDGLGWVQLEVTGSASGSGGSDFSSDTLIIKPADATKMYDGTELVATDIEGSGDYAYYFRELLNNGYTYYVEFSGSQTEVGSSSSKIKKFILYDADGNDVTSQFNIVCTNGTLTVTDQVVIYVYLYDISQVYDGTALSYYEDDYYWSDDDYDVYIDGLTSISVTNYGTLNSDMLDSLVITVEKDGVDVTDSVIVKIDTTYLLTVYRRSITVTAGSAEMVYSGSALTDSSYTISGGGLADGDTMTVVIKGSITEVGSSTNRITSLIITNSAGVDVTDNYDITTVYGTLTVTSD